MNKLRVFQNVYQKRAGQGFLQKSPGTVLLLLLFLPYIISFLLGNRPVQDEEVSLLIRDRLLTGNIVVKNQTDLGKEEIPFEMYVADKLARTMDESYEKEALKAQAVLIRTNLLGGNEKEILTEDNLYGKTKVSDIHFLAAAETKGMVLEYGSEPVYGAFFKSSNGCTRNATESCLQEEYPYFVSVPCSRDFMSGNNYSTITYTKEYFEDLWKQIPKISSDGNIKEGTTENKFTYVRDSAGYVVYFSYDKEWVTGEEFRYAFMLASSDFRIKEDGNDYVFEVAGEGHGFGMSQFGANEMAKEGEDFLTILEYFFEGTTLVKVNG